MPCASATIFSALPFLAAKAAYCTPASRGHAGLLSKGSIMAHVLQQKSRSTAPVGVLASEEASRMERRILIAEDNEVNRQQLQQVLEADQKVKVDTTNDGIEALEALVGNNYSILLTDL